MAVMTYRDAIAATLAEEMARDDRVFVLGEDIAPSGAFKTTAGLADRFGVERVRNTPISEQAILGAAVGAAMTGMRPVAEIMFGDFLGVCWDFIANQIPALRYSTGGQLAVPLVIKSSTGAGIGFASHHSHAVESWVMAVPGIKIAVPSGPGEYKGLMTAAIRDPDPVIVLDLKAQYPVKGEVPDGEYVIPLGQASVVQRGADVTLIALGSTVRTCVEAAEKLEEEAIAATVIDLRCLVPLDAATVLGEVATTGRAVIVEEGPEQLGWGTTVASILADEAFDHLRAPVRRLCSANVPTPYAGALESAAQVSVDAVVDAARKSVRR
ncbi:alpha-ketoacid dehydrogenase subunit beta [Amycolatopsis benzoatilytica]|uniref:alpha-ketoacid dehydrogenase subunit beta n=1 Tax=Amycolatopsis benzoatilytica TaxID=346045 RepID=UPI000372C8A3|nr:transketolase C-terminal domain-containing protein [Amycolatopsis benzoatilytica]